MICRINVVLVVVRLLMICLKRRGDRYYSYTVVTHHGSIVVIQAINISIFTKYTVNLERIIYIRRSKNLLRYAC